MPDKMLGTWRKVEGEDGRTWLIRTDVLNSGDHVHVDTHDPNSRGYGGSLCGFTLEDGTVYEVKGPWHSSFDPKLITTAGVNLSELHYTRVRVLDENDGVLYEEKEMTLGSFNRGDRIADQIAMLRGKPVYLWVDTAGGAHGGTVIPGEELHRLHVREGDNLRQKKS